MFKEKRDTGLVDVSMPRIAHDFSLSVLPDTSGVLEQRAFADGTVERISVRIYQGPELDLHLDPYVMRFNQRRQDLIHYVGKKYIDGDDDRYIYAVNVPIRMDELLVVFYSNLDPAYTYDFRVTIEVDYAGGLYRFPFTPLKVTGGAA